MDSQMYVLFVAAVAAVLPGGLLLAYVHRRTGGLPEGQEGNGVKRDGQSVGSGATRTADRRHLVVQIGRWPSSWS